VILLDLGAFKKSDGGGELGEGAIFRYKVTGGFHVGNSNTFTAQDQGREKKNLLTAGLGGYRAVRPALHLYTEGISRK